MPIDF